MGFGWQLLAHLQTQVTFSCHVFFTCIVLRLAECLGVGLNCVSNVFGSLCRELKRITCLEVINLQLTQLAVQDFLNTAQAALSSFQKLIGCVNIGTPNSYGLVVLILGGFKLLGQALCLCF